ncbi:MAG TPA: hypothetical protein VEE82_02875 [Thermodesulfovibrionales bacterium]|nr:hypothetical protein [Thermodesulfovibrionales bacterium]
MAMRSWLFCLCIAIPLLFGGCAKSSPQVVELKRFPLDTLDGIITQSGAELDTETTSDGNGSLRIKVTRPTTVRLFEINDVNVENARLTYQAKLRSKNLEGQAYLEMWCCFSGRGEFFSRGLQDTVSGTMRWITAETPFFLKKDERPDVIKLNLVINGKGTVWIDDVRLLKGPLQ